MSGVLHINNALHFNRQTRSYIHEIDDLAAQTLTLLLILPNYQTIVESAANWINKFRNVPSKPTNNPQCCFLPSRCSSMFEGRCVVLFLVCVCFPIAFAFACFCLFAIAVCSARDTQHLLNFAVFVVTFVVCCANLPCLCVACCSSLAGHRGCSCIR